MTWLAANFLVLHICFICLGFFFFLWEHKLVWDILHQTGQLTVPEPQCLTPLTGPLDVLHSFAFPLTHIFWLCSDNSDTSFSPLPPFLPPSLFGLHLLFSAWEPEAALCVSQMKHLTSLLGVVILVTVAGSSVSNVHQGPQRAARQLLQDTVHADCPYGPSVYMNADIINTKQGQLTVSQIMSFWFRGYTQDGPFFCFCTTHVGTKTNCTWWHPPRLYLGAFWKLIS